MTDLWGRIRRSPGLIAAAAAVLAVSASVAAGHVDDGEGDRELVLADAGAEGDQPRATGESPSSTSTTSEASITSSSTSSTTMASTTTSAAPPTTVDADTRCVSGNSDQAVPPEGREQTDEPLAVEACAPDRAAAGQPIHLTVHAFDPDAPLPDGIEDDGTGSACSPHSVWWGDKDTQCYVTPGCAETQVPTPAQRGEATYELSHTYDRPGTYEITIDVMSGNQCEFTYSDQVVVTLTVVVG